MHTIYSLGDSKLQHIQHGPTVSSKTDVDVIEYLMQRGKKRELLQWQRYPTADIYRNGNKSSDIGVLIGRIYIHQLFNHGFWILKRQRPQYFNFTWTCLMTLRTKSADNHVPCQALIPVYMHFPPDHLIRLFICAVRFVVRSTAIYLWFVIINTIFYTNAKNKFTLIAVNLHWNALEYSYRISESLSHSCPSIFGRLGSIFWQIYAHTEPANFVSLDIGLRYDG